MGRELRQDRFMYSDAAGAFGGEVPDWASRLAVRPVRPEERARWRSTMAERHYRGFRGLVGDSGYDVACIADPGVALLGWAAAAWRWRPRDQ